jgi:hypothetical protein
MPGEHRGVVLYSANSAATLSSSTPAIQNTISSVIDNLNEKTPGTSQVPETGHYVTRIGDTRVVWRREDGRILVLTIFSDKDPGIILP